MAYNDIQRLRQQTIFNPIEDITMGDMSYTPTDFGGGPDYGYEPPSNPFEQAPSPTFGSPTGGMPQQASSGQAGMGAPPPITPMRVQKTSEESLQETIDAINRVYTPETTDRDRLRALMDAAPERQPASLARALVASGLSIKAQDPLATAEKYMYAPHYRAMADWKEKADPFLKTAELENRGNINERTLASNVVTSHTQAERLAEQARVADQKNEVAQKRAESERIRALANKAKAEGFKVYKAGDRFKGMNNAGDVIDLGPSGGIDRETELDIIGEWSVKAAQARGEAGVKIAQASGVAGGKDVVFIDNKPYRLNPEGTAYIPVQGLPSGVATKPGTVRVGGTTNTLETRRQKSDTLKNIYQYDEENRKFIKKGNNDTYDFILRPKVRPKGWLEDEVTQAQVDAYDEFRKSIEPSYVPPVTKSGGVGGSAGSGKETPTKGPGIGPTQSQINDWSGNEQGPADTPAPSKESRPTIGNAVGQVPGNDPALEQRAVGYLISHNLKVTPANIAYAIKTGKLAPASQRR